ncbi:murein hydrolase activator EnvC family protein [Myroides odoratimimus]|uniref:murein hydrolase activator EnvC family protein n=1 Tax=Myroides odoratimimus TaxID=76832 RepID=UPI002574F7DF|nr:peptidoglycan DD-metalloendopeptidase family protein [Myroides odoratimimus]MDM1536280.1 peptidoglycan DD-metalloendopeptidase family protein [Myroides odoratimimus]MDM1675852.1 peptidoglycan DD-metalloendopeptidase family protein [Myroides odoratimimus]MEC4041199.1 peptidoglycan DD-metalloendopeptidase family protein [Myroides odoratimimus]MEC4149039.1 peptidoglycan DD-metalloendopeptidase family protein [Myroides odoratimimus]
MRRAYLSLLLICTVFAYGQKKETQEQLERRKQQILVEINIVKDLLKKEKTKERNILLEIDENNRKINLNRQLINNVQKQISATNSNISKTEKEVNTLEAELAKLRKDYADLVLKSYKTKSSQSRLMFILSSDNFLQAYKRVQYMKQYADYRKSQADEVKAKAESLKEALARLSTQKAKQQKLLTEQQQNEKNLQEDLGEQKNLMSIVQKDQQKYNKHIKQKQEETKAIDRKIKQLIKEAIEEANRIAREKAAKEGKKTTKSTASTKSATAFELTPEGKIVADNFRANQGKLPWPVAKGYISLPYGNQPHPVQTQLTIHNSGVEITTEAGARARAVFGGDVLQVQVLPGGNKAVLIQHGDYITVYQNLGDVSVKKGDKVSLKQDIGSISTNSNGQTVLKFLLSRNTDIYNPQSWLSRSN